MNHDEFLRICTSGDSRHDSDTVEHVAEMELRSGPLDSRIAAALRAMDALDPLVAAGVSLGVIAYATHLRNVFTAVVATDPDDLAAHIAGELMAAGILAADLATSASQRLRAAEYFAPLDNNQGADQ